MNFSSLMDHSDSYAWVPLENYLPLLGKKLKKEYQDAFGEEPPKHPHPIKGSEKDMHPAYYPRPWLKAQLGLY